MQVQPRLEPLGSSDFFADGQAAREPVLGTIARGQFSSDTYFSTGFIGKSPGNYMPFPATREVFERGRERFNIYCSPCHGTTGDGNGMVVQRGYRRPPSYHTDRLRNEPLGHFFDVITNGFGAMPDYASQVPPYDRWTIVAYIRALQFSQNAPESAVPAGVKLSSSVGSAPEAPASDGSSIPAQVSANLPNAVQKNPLPHSTDGIETQKKVNAQ